MEATSYEIEDNAQRYYSFLITTMWHTTKKKQIVFVTAQVWAVKGIKPTFLLGGRLRSPLSGEG